MVRKTAIVIIHGIGEQKPFETLDSFIRPLAQSYQEQAKTKMTLQHNLVWFNNWGESCLSIIPAASTCNQLDVFEYYWSHMTQRAITPAEVIEWLIKVSKGAKSYYKRQKKQIKSSSERNDVLYKKDGEFDHLEYLVRMLSFGGLLKYLYWIGILLAKTFPFLKVFKAPVMILFNALKSFLAPQLVNYMGDVALYCNTDVKSEYYAIRKNILDGAVEKIQLLLNNKDYDEVLICGHSLGSVITYDTIDRINIQMHSDITLRQNASKLKGITTFGSPLDKISFFFDEHINREKQPLRFSITAHLHGFRKKMVEHELPSNMQWYLGTIPWLNFWSQTDVVSGYLDVYDNVTNIQMDFSSQFEGKKFSKTKLLAFSHTLYWETPAMYDHIVKTFLIPSTIMVSPKEKPAEMSRTDTSLAN
jgi:hypothetical protein